MRRALVRFAGAAILAALAALAGGDAGAQAMDEIAAPLGGLSGDAARGRRALVDRDGAHCLLCHQAPIAEERFHGDLAPTLAGVGSRLTPGQIRLRIVDPSRVNPETIMPAYFRLDGLIRVGAPWRGRTILNEQQIEDIVAYLSSLKE